MGNDMQNVIVIMDPFVFTGCNICDPIYSDTPLCSTLRNSIYGIIIRKGFRRSPYLGTVKRLMPLYGHCKNVSWYFRIMFFV